MSEYPETPIELVARITDEDLCERVRKDKTLRDLVGAYLFRQVQEFKGEADGRDEETDE